MVAAYTEENSGKFKALPSATLTCPHIASAHKPRPLPGLNSGSHIKCPQPPPDLTSAGTAALFRGMYNEPSALCPQHFLRALLSQSPDTKQHSQIFTEQTAASQGHCTGKRKQSKCHSHYILIIYQSLQMSLTCSVTKHPTTYVLPA